MRGGIEIIYEIKKPAYNTEYRHAQYMKNREEINRKARARYRAKCGLKAIKEAE